jgi:hypothetical protein
MVIQTKDKVVTILKNDLYKLCMVKGSVYKSLYLKRNLVRSKLTIISIKRASKLFSMEKEELKEIMIK